MLLLFVLAVGLACCSSCDSALQMINPSSGWEAVGIQMGKLRQDKGPEHVPGCFVLAFRV